jgi:hypothetical protein
VRGSCQCARACTWPIWLNPDHGKNKNPILASQRNAMQDGKGLPSESSVAVKLCSRLRSYSVEERHAIRRAEAGGVVPAFSDCEGTVDAEAEI